MFDTGGYGLYDLNDSGGSIISNGCNLRPTTRNRMWEKARQLPDWYNAHDNKKEFPIITASPREVKAELNSDDNVEKNIDRASRNLPEAVAAKARDEGIYVFTLGMGSALKAKSGYDNEVGENVLKCMANVADGPSRCYNPDKPVGMYCYAATEADLTPCFSRLASAILRISK